MATLASHCTTRYVANASHAYIYIFHEWLRADHLTHRTHRQSQSEGTQLMSSAMVTPRTFMRPGVSNASACKHSRLMTVAVAPPFPIFLDTGIVQKNMNAHYSGSPQTYASALATRITVSAHLASSVSIGTYCTETRDETPLMVR